MVQNYEKCTNKTMQNENNFRKLASVKPDIFLGYGLLLLVSVVCDLIFEVLGGWGMVKSPLDVNTARIFSSLLSIFFNIRITMMVFLFEMACICVLLNYTQVKFHQQTSLENFIIVVKVVFFTALYVGLFVLFTTTINELGLVWARYKCIFEHPWEVCWELYLTAQKISHNW